MPPTGVGTICPSTGGDSVTLLHYTAVASLMGCLPAAKDSGPKRNLGPITEIILLKVTPLRQVHLSQTTMIRVAHRLCNLPGQ